MAAYRDRSVNLTGEGVPETVLGYAASPELFPLLGVSPQLGRTFTEEEARNLSPVAVLSHQLWQNRFGGDRGIVGRQILINRARYSVIGVMPKSFLFPSRACALWLPLYFSPEDLNNRRSHFLNAVARLKAGVTVAQARADMHQIVKRLEIAHPEMDSRVDAVVLPLRDDRVGDIRPTLLILVAASGLVLLIASSNLANMLLARATGRSREMAIRAALGAGSRRLMRLVVVESLMLAAAGGAAGILLASWCLGVLEKLVPVALAPTLSLDGRVLTFTAAISVAAGVLFGLAPALQSARVELNAVLKQAGARAGVSGTSRRLRNMLVVSEVALAMVLLVGAGLMLQTLGRLGSTDPGFQPERLLTVTTELPGTRYSTGAERMAFANSVMDRLHALPGVVSAGFASDLPFTSIGDSDGCRVEGRPNPGNAALDALYRETTNGYLQTIGARLVAGRFFSEFDRAGSQLVLIVNETFARMFWPSPQSALGHRVQVGGEAEPWRTIAGVVADIRERGLLLSMKPAVYLDEDQVHRPNNTYLAVRTAGDPLSLLPAVRQAIWSVDREQPVSNPGSMRDLMRRETGSRRQAMILLNAFAALALVLAGLGIYGVLSFAVAQRTREIGIRLALGAEPGSVVGMMLRTGLNVAGIGVAAGVAAAFVLTRALAHLPYGVSAADPLTFAAVAVFLLTVSAVACYVPARRAATVDPLIALRYE